MSQPFLLELTCSQSVASQAHAHLEVGHGNDYCSISGELQFLTFCPGGTPPGLPRY
jgi:hypothetical protein